MTNASLVAILPSEVSLLRAGAELIDMNPFGKRRMEIERALLDHHPAADDKVVDLPGPAAVMEILWPVVRNICKRLRTGAPATGDDLATYTKVAILVMSSAYDADFQRVIETGHLEAGAFDRFAGNYSFLFYIPGLALEVPEPEVLFSILYQVRRATHIILTTLRGVSAVTAHLREQVWNAIFAGDLLRYIRWKHAHMEGMTTLILGETGTGKELVARALAFARFIPFDPKAGKFATEAGEGFHALNVSSLPVTLADSLLFGHRRGSFTGATEDAPGALAECGPGAFLFLDEVGDLDASIQVKLLRVLEEGKYRPVGGHKDLEILGRLIFATQPGLLKGTAMRRDLRYRIFKNVIWTPSLRARLDDDPGELPLLVRLFAEHEAGPYGGALTEEVLALIRARYASHKWPGNVRELKACVENVASQHDYTPAYSLEAPKTSRRTPAQVTVTDTAAAPAPPNDGEGESESAGEELARAVMEGEISLDELRERYILLAVEQAEGNYTEAAARLRIDRRTVRAVAEAAGVSPPEGERRRGGRSGGGEVGR